jgi:hypothetical protein
MIWKGFDLGREHLHEKLFSVRRSLAAVIASYPDWSGFADNRSVEIPSTRN